MNYGDGAGHLAVTGSAGGIFLLGTQGSFFLAIAFLVVGTLAIIIRRRFRPHVNAIDPMPDESSTSSNKTDGP